MGLVVPSVDRGSQQSTGSSAAEQVHRLFAGAFQEMAPRTRFSLDLSSAATTAVDFDGFVGQIFRTKKATPRNFAR